MNPLIRASCVAALLAVVHPAAAAAQSRQEPTANAPATEEPATNPPTVQEQDMVVGAWELDLSKSTFMPGPAPRGEVRSYQEEHEGIKADILTTNADGTRTRMEYVASFNVPIAMVTGSQQTDAIRLRRIDAYTSEGQLFYMGQAVGQTRRVVSKDGQTMTITLDRTAPATVHNVFVYRRVR